MIVADLEHLATPVDKLSLLPGNPRKGDVEAVARSLARFGQRKPIVARRDGTVTAGNHTLQAARQLGWPAIAVVWVDDDDATAAAFALADNRTAELGLEVQAADPELLADTAWDEASVAALIAQIEADEAAAAAAAGGGIQGDPDDVPDSAPAITIEGDVWKLGEHLLVCGDSTDPTVVDRVMKDGPADIVWTDPPYGVAYEGKAGSIKNDALAADQLADLLRMALGNALANCKAGGAWFVAGPDMHGPFRSFVDVLHDLGVYRQCIVWVKDQFVLGRMDYHARHELIFRGWAPGAAHTGPPDRAQDTVWEIARPKRSDDHPTMKPVELVERCITNHSKPGAVVLDPFGGSGTTLIAAHASGRRARLVELDPRFCDVICRRYQEATGQLPVHAKTRRKHSFVED